MGRQTFFIGLLVNSLVMIFFRALLIAFHWFPDGIEKWSVIFSIIFSVVGMVMLLLERTRKKQKIGILLWLFLCIFAMNRQNWYILSGEADHVSLVALILIYIEIMIIYIALVVMSKKVVIEKKEIYEIVEKKPILLTILFVLSYVNLPLTDNANSFIQFLVFYPPLFGIGMVWVFYHKHVIYQKVLSQFNK